MAYNQVGTPRFYIDNISWLQSAGVGHPAIQWQPGGSVYGLDMGTIPTFTSQTTGLNQFADYYYHAEGEESYSVPLPLVYNFVAFLGHNLATTSAGYGDIVLARTISATTALGITVGYYSEDIVNHSFLYDGFTIAEFTPWTGTHYQVYVKIVNGEVGGLEIKLGRVIAGKYFDMSHSPDLSLTLGFETGTKTIETKGGASLSNTMWRPPLWNDLAPWELYDPVGVDDPSTTEDTETTYLPAKEMQLLARSSRRTWNLSFSFLDKTNVFSKYNALNRLIDLNETLPDDETLITSDNFFSAVWNKVGTKLPFVFQPDNSVTEFAICKFQEGFSFEQVANGVYNCEMEIREVW